MTAVYVTPRDRLIEEITHECRGMALTDLTYLLAQAALLNRARLEKPAIAYDPDPDPNGV